MNATKHVVSLPVTFSDAGSTPAASTIITTLFSSVYEDGCITATYFHIFSEGKLRKLAEDTGGRLIEARGMNKIADEFDQISEELHHQYSLGYYPENTTWDGRFRKIEIVAADHHDRVTARKGYYAIPPEQR